MLIIGSTILNRNKNLITITYDLNNCVSSNQTSMIEIQPNTEYSYSTTLIANELFSYCGAQIMMGDKDITNECYNILTGEINIPSINGHIVIKAEAITTFADTSWFAIKNVAQNKLAAELGWKVGDTKELIIGSYTYTVRIADLTENRYQYYHDETKYSNMVLEVVQLLPDNAAKSNANAGNYADNTIRTYYNETIIPQFPYELQSLLETVIIPTWWSTNEYSSASETGVSNDKLFMPGLAELGYGEYGNGTVFDYYQEFGNPARIKYKVNNPDTPERWWCRDSGRLNNYTWYVYEQIGITINTDGGHSTTGTSNIDESLYMKTQYAIPVVWAW